MRVIRVILRVITKSGPKQIGHAMEGREEIRPLNFVMINQMFTVDVNAYKIVTPTQRHKPLVDVAR